MQNLKILNSKEIKHIKEILSRQYGVKEFPEYVWMLNKDNRIYIINKELATINTDVIKIDSLGLYFGELYKESLRLSIEGAQIIAVHATKNIIELNDEEMIAWLKGADIEWIESENKDPVNSASSTSKDFLIVKNLNRHTGKFDILGCGKFKDNKLINYVSKSRRLVVVNN